MRSRVSLRVAALYNRAMNERTRSALTSLGEALGSNAQSEDELEWLEAIVSADSKDRVSRRQMSSDPYPDLVLALAPANAELEVAGRVTGLRAYQTSWWPHHVFYVDEQSDPSGEHRVYVRDEELLPGALAARFGSVAELVELWSAAAVGTIPDEFESAPEDEWESSTSSGSFVFETLVRASVSSQWAVAGIDAFVARRPELGMDPLPVGELEHPRVLCLHALRVLRLAGRFTLPEHTTLDELPAPHREYLEHLEELQTAFFGEEPELLSSLSKSGGSNGAQAKAWLKGFREARDAEPEPEPELDLAPPELTPFEKRLRTSVDGAIAHLIAEEQIEVLDRGMLLDELTRVAEKARSLKHLVRKLVHTLVESEALEEVYATDGELESVFRSRLE